MKIQNTLSSLLSVSCVVGIVTSAYAQNMTLQQSQEKEEYREQHLCLALNIYHEARSESRLGQKAVGLVTLNRVQSQRYPDTVCDVVHEANVDANGNPIRNQCQFSWWCDGKSDVPLNVEKWEEIQLVAHDVIQDYGLTEDFTAGATMYHASYANPYWASSYERTVRIDTHIFYK